MEKSEIQEANTKNFDNYQANKAPTKQQYPINEKKEEFLKIPIDLIVTESNIRTEYNDEEIQGLALSMQQYGQLQPIRVYEEKGEYVVIFGHRRLLAAIHNMKQKKGPLDINCILVEKPDSLDIIYQQAIENEHAVKISSEDREKYVAKLRKSQTPEEIAVNLGKSVPWVYQVLKAGEVRKEHGEAFIKAGLPPLTTRDIRSLAGYSKEEVESVIYELVEKPWEKTAILEKKRRERSKKKPSSITKINSETAGEKESLKTMELDRDEESRGFCTSEPELINSNDETEMEKANTGGKNVSGMGKGMNEISDIQEMKVVFLIRKNGNSSTVKLISSVEGDIFIPGIQAFLGEKLSLYLEGEGYTVEP